VKHRILTGTYVLSSGYYDAYYLVAQKVRRRITTEFATAFEGLDAILLPTAPTPAFKRGEFSGDPIRMYMADIFTLPVNLAGLPGLSLNAGFSREGLPVGMQFIGPKWGDATLLRLASTLERTFGRAAARRLRRRREHDTLVYTRDRSGNTRPARREKQDLLSLFDGLYRRRPEHERLPGLPRPSGRPSGSQRRRRGDGGPHRARAPLHDP
jgi:hypothetical protein